MNEQVICNLLEEAFNNPVRKGNCFVVGKTKSGMEIKIVFVKNINGLAVKAAFPAYNGELNGLSLVKKIGRTVLKQKV